MCPGFHHKKRWILVPMQVIIKIVPQAFVPHALDFSTLGCFCLLLIHSVVIWLWNPHQRLNRWTAHLGILTSATMSEVNFFFIIKYTDTGILSQRQKTRLKPGRRGASQEVTCHGIEKS